MEIALVYLHSSGLTALKENNGLDIVVETQELETASAKTDSSRKTKSWKVRLNPDHPCRVKAWSLKQNPDHTCRVKAWSLKQNPDHTCRVKALSLKQNPDQIV